MADIAKRDENRIHALLAKSNAADEILALLVDSVTQRLLVNSTISGSVTADNLGTSAIAGQKTVAVTNTAVALATSTTVKNGIIIQALAANTGNVVIGGASVTTANGFQLQPGQATSIAIDNLASVFVNGTAGDGVCFISSV
jgi:hypothetical protein